MAFVLSKYTGKTLNTHTGGGGQGVAEVQGHPDYTQV